MTSQSNQDDLMLLALCQKLDSMDPETIDSAAITIINTTPDSDYRREFMVKVTKYQTAKDSVEMNEAFEDIIQYVKKLFASIYAQGFTLGASYKTRMFNESLNKAIQASQPAQSKEEEKDLGIDVDDPIVKGI